MESRDHFVARLETAVAWMNHHKKAELEKFSRNQKERARDCLSNKPRGSRTKW